MPVKQFQYIGWPEEGIPDNGGGLIDLIGQVQKWQRSSGDKPIVVHCRLVSVTESPVHACVASFPGTHFYLLFVFTIIHESGRLAKLFPVHLYYCKRKWEIKMPGNEATVIVAQYS